MKLAFTKLHGAENDFLFAHAANWPSLSGGFLRNIAIDLCSRHTGLGADGFVLYEKGSANNAKMLIVNSDGSFAGTCGNALRCLGLLLMRQGLWDGASDCPVERIVPIIQPENTPESFLLDRGPFAILESGELLKNGEQAQVGVLMGVEKAAPQSRGTPLLQSEIAHDFHMLVGDVREVLVELANPHWVFLSSGFHGMATEEIIRFGRHAQGVWRTLGRNVPLANIGMLSPTGTDNEYNLTVFERGVGLTRCCGSGATAARAALESWDVVKPEVPFVHMKMPGGTVSIGWQKNNGPQRLLLGPASMIADLEVELKTHTSL